MLRTITLADSAPIIELTTATGFFKPRELAALREVLVDYHKENHELGHRGLVWEEGERMLGYIYYAPVIITEGSWYLFWIVVARDAQRQGVGTRLLEYVEKDVRDRGGRMLLIETSMTPHYAPTRRFYLKYGYKVAAEIPDYYADGDGMVVFTKRMAPQ